MEPLWVCPECGHAFVTVNLWHSCGRFSLDDHFRNTEPNVRRVFDHYTALVKSLGPVTIYAQKTRIVFMVRVRFIAVYTRVKWLRTHLWLHRQAEHPLLEKVELLPPNNYINYFQLTEPADLDEAFMELVSESYRVGCQEA